MKEEKVICTICGEELDRDEAFEYNGKYYCQDYFNDNYVQCEDCGEYVPIDDTYTTYDGRTICLNCFDDNYFTCEDCGGIFPQDEGYWIENKDNYVCEKCFNWGGYFCCEDCGSYYSNDVEVYICNRDMYICEDCLDNGDYFTCEDCGRHYSFGRMDYCYIENYGYVCNDCYESGNYYYDDDDCCYYIGSGIIGSYHSHGSFCNFGEDSQQRRFGIELEVENKTGDMCCCNMATEISDDLGNRAYFEHDGSLDNGFEIITEPHTIEAFNEIDWKTVLNKLSSNGYRSHDTGTCGLHMHASRTWFGSDREEEAQNIAKLLICYSTNWDFFLKMSRRTQEQANHWASRYCTDEDFETVKEVAKSRYDSRYRAINLTNDATVEFRLGRGTLNYKSFMAWIDIHLALVKNAINIPEEEASDLRLWLNGISDETLEYIKSRSYEYYILLKEGERQCA